MNKQATIITAHIPYFEYLKNLLDSFHKFVEQPHDLFVMFSDEYSFSVFQQMYNKPYHYIILPNELRALKSPVNVKKLFGVGNLYKTYDYIGVFDCDTEFVKSCDLNAIYKEIGDRNWIKSNEASVGGEIIKKVATILGYNENHKVIEQTKGFTQYWWFSDIPVYKSEWVGEFIDWVNEHPNKDVIFNEYHCFDYLLWTLWLIVNKEFKVIPQPFSDEIGVVENFRIPQTERKRILDTFQPYWAPDKSIHHLYPNIKLIVHNDKWV